MYPLNMKLEKGEGYAVANTEEEHKALSDLGYVPKYVAPVKAKAAPAPAPAA